MSKSRIAINGRVSCCCACAGAAAAAGCCARTATAAHAVRASASETLVRNMAIILRESCCVVLEFQARAFSGREDLQFAFARLVGGAQRDLVERLVAVLGLGVEQRELLPARSQPNL